MALAGHTSAPGGDRLAGGRTLPSLLFVTDPDRLADNIGPEMAARALALVETAGHTLRDLRVAEVVKTDMTVKDGKVQAYRTRVLLSFKYGS